ncbi:hypothetical protein Vretimale_4635, partial [Volvox reticuliferus]
TPHWKPPRCYAGENPFAPAVPGAKSRCRGGKTGIKLMPGISTTMVFETATRLASFERKLPIHRFPHSHPASRMHGYAGAVTLHVSFFRTTASGIPNAFSRTSSALACADVAGGGEECASSSCSRCVSFSATPYVPPVSSVMRRHTYTSAATPTTDTLQAYMYARPS